MPLRPRVALRQAAPEIGPVIPGSPLYRLLELAASGVVLERTSGRQEQDGARPVEGKSEKNGREN
jgi:hypothetical protein